MSIGKNIQKVSKELGMSISDLAKQASMPERTVRSIVSDEIKNPTVQSIKKIIIALGVSADMILFDDEELGENGDLKILFRELERLEYENRDYAKKVIKAIIVQLKNQELE